VRLPPLRAGCEDRFFDDIDPAQLPPELLGKFRARSGGDAKNCEAGGSGSGGSGSSGSGESGGSGGSGESGSGAGRALELDQFMLSAVARYDLEAPLPSAREEAEGGLGGAEGARRGPSEGGGGGRRQGAAPAHVSAGFRARGEVRCRAAAGAPVFASLEAFQAASAAAAASNAGAGAGVDPWAGVVAVLRGRVAVAVSGRSAAAMRSAASGHWPGATHGVGRAEPAELLRPLTGFVDRAHLQPSFGDAFGDAMAEALEEALEEAPPEAQGAEAEAAEAAGDAGDAGGGAAAIGARQPLSPSPASPRLSSPRRLFARPWRALATLRALGRRRGPAEGQGGQGGEGGEGDGAEGVADSKVSNQQGVGRVGARHVAPAGGVAEAQTGYPSEASNSFGGVDAELSVGGGHDRGEGSWESVELEPASTEALTTFSDENGARQSAAGASAAGASPRQSQPGRMPRKFTGKWFRGKLRRSGL
jgi:hypothetical protein